jgi:CRISPR-associated protein (TIGR03986 family)
MSQVHAPYHFVPFSRWVYMPDWAHLVSHDVPFKTGYSGKISYQLTNATPLLVGGEQQTRKEQPTLVQWAKDPAGNPVIPGSSLKGMTRNVLEIASFGKCAAMDDGHFSYRDLSNAVYAQKLRGSHCQAYWLKFDNTRKQWTLRKARHIELFHDEFNHHTGCDIENVAFKQPSEKKYQQWSLSKQAVRFSINEREILGTKGKNVRVARATTLGEGENLGHPVFSGFRPGLKRYIGDRLNYSYIFYDTEPTARVFNNGDVLANKLFANHGEALVKYLKANPHPEYGIPVFAREDKAGGKMLALGFAKMPRVLYDQSVLQTAHSQQKAAGSELYFDMPELLFGCLKDNGLSLKSRVTFADAVCDENKGLYTSDPVILGQPKASYLAAYLEQPNAKDSTIPVTKTNDLSQYEKNSQLAGWKRYPAQTSFNNHLPADLKDKTAVQSQLELMRANSRFSGQIIYHNLKAEELGALLWALQFGQTPDNSACYHGLGHGKSLGAGAVQLTITGLSARPNQPETPQQGPADSEAFISQFVAHMNEVYPGNEMLWQDSPQLAHLLAFADRADNDGKDLTYMPLTGKSREDTTVTYTSSVKGREKQVLPAWKANDKPLSRVESIDTKNTTITSFGQGRLAELLKQQKDNEGLTLFESAELEKTLAAGDKVNEQKALAAFAELPPTAQAFVLLEKSLAPFKNLNTPQAKAGRQACNTAIEKLLDECLDTYVEASFIQALYDICVDVKLSAYLDLAKSKKNKGKLAARKGKLGELVERYGLGG